MQTPRKASEIIAIDILRACAALGVFFYHNRVGGMAARYSGISFLRRTDGFGAIYAVPLFFLISGYCIHASNVKYLQSNSALPLKVYFRRRFFRIYPAYLAALAIAIGVNMLTRFSSAPSLTDILVHTVALQSFSVRYFNTINLVLWTITVEIAFYILYPAFYYLRAKYSLKHAMIFTFVISAFSIIYFELQTAITAPERFCVFNLWFAWCSGAFLADKMLISKISLNKTGYWLAYLFILIGFIYFNYFDGNHPLLLDQFNILVWTGPLIYLISKEQWFKKAQTNLFIKIFAAIGLSSYSLYLLHEPLSALKNFIVHKYLPAGLQFGGVIIGLFMIPTIAWLSYYYIERPFMSRKPGTSLAGNERQASASQPELKR